MSQSSNSRSDSSASSGMSVADEDMLSNFICPNTVITAASTSSAFGPSSPLWTTSFRVMSKELITEEHSMNWTEYVDGSRL